MTEKNQSTIDPSIARRLDQVAKLLGVGLVALGLEVGGGTTLGLTLGITGALLALASVFVAVGSETDSDSAAEDPPE